jgi:hypothetical protein
MVTNDATTTIKAGILTESGIIFRNMEISILDMTRTTVVESPIPIPLIAEVVTARVGHIPSIRTKIGFSVIIPFFNLSPQLFIFNYPPKMRFCNSR